MNLRNILLFIFLGLLIIIGAILVTPYLRQEPAPPPANPVAILSPAPVQLPAAELPVLFGDDFDTPTSRWDMGIAGQAEQTRQAMLLSDTKIDGAAWVRPRLVFADFILDVDMRWLDGSIGGSYGLQVRLDEAGNSYGLFLRNDGRYALVKNVAGVSETVAGGFSDYIDRDGGVNHVRIEAVGPTLRFFVNNAYLLDYTDGNLAAGDIMLTVVKAEGTDLMTVAFDNVRVAQYPRTP